jgi:hypothetical protein
MRHLVSLLAVVALSACTSISVQPVDPALNVQHVCIQENTAVIIEDFVDYLQDDFARYGITTEVIGNQRPRHCEYVLSYTARRSWDMTPYMSTADLTLTRNGHRIGSANYYLKGKGGFSLSKYASTESKLDNVVDQLLAGYDEDPVAAVEPDDADSVFSANVEAELAQLDALRERGVITDEQYEDEKEQLLKAN